MTYASRRATSDTYISYRYISYRVAMTAAEHQAVKVAAVLAGQPLTTYVADVIRAGMATLSTGKGSK